MPAGWSAGEQERCRPELPSQSKINAAKVPSSKRMTCPNSMDSSRRCLFYAVILSAAKNPCISSLLLLVLTAVVAAAVVLAVPLLFLLSFRRICLPFAFDRCTLVVCFTSALSLPLYSSLFVLRRHSERSEEPLYFVFAVACSYCCCCRCGCPCRAVALFAVIP